MRRPVPTATDTSRPPIVEVMAEAHGASLCTCETWKPCVCAGVCVGDGPGRRPAITGVGGSLARGGSVVTREVHATRAAIEHAIRAACDACRRNPTAGRLVTCFPP